jgi:hypothetical protein
MKTNWRELRDSLSIPGTFDPLNPISLDTPGRKNTETNDDDDKVKRVKRAESQNLNSETYMANKVKRAKSPSIDTTDLEASMKRLAQGICIAIFEDGEIRVVMREPETVAAIDAGGTIYSPRDMYYHCQLTQRERCMLHDFKKRFGGTIEWKAEA